MNVNLPTKKVQVIRFSGSGLDCKAETLRGGPVDLSKMGEIAVRRSSEILFDEAQQKYYVCFLEPTLQSLNPEMRVKFYDTYELAVAEEVRVINENRIKGIV